MNKTFFNVRRCFSARAWALAGSIVLLASGGQGLAQSSAPSRRVPGARGRDAAAAVPRGLAAAAPHRAARRRESPHHAAGADQPDLELRLYGTDARNIQVTEHNGVPDLWTGFTTSPVALTLRHKNAYLDLTGLTRMRWRTRTENLHVLHPVVKLADGTLLVGSQTFSSPQRPMVGSNAFSGNFVVSEVTFDDQRWFQLDPVKVVTMKEVGNPDLSRVDEIGFVDLMPGGGHGFAGCSNVSWIEVYASPRKR